MTLEELKIEADKLGYKLIKAKEKEYVKILPCPVCGKKNTCEWSHCSNDGHSTVLRRCNSCGFDGYFGKNSREGRLAWNEAVKVYLKGENNHAEN